MGSGQLNGNVNGNANGGGGGGVDGVTTTSGSSSNTNSSCYNNNWLCKWRWPQQQQQHVAKNNNNNSLKGGGGGGVRRLGLSSSGYVFVVWCFVVYVFVGFLYGWLALKKPYMGAAGLSSFGCQEDSEGSWSIGVFFGNSPFSLKPIETVSGASSLFQIFNSAVNFFFEWGLIVTTWVVYFRFFFWSKCADG